MAEKGIDVPFEEIDVFGAENRRPPYSDNNPAGQLPALELDAALVHVDQADESGNGQVLGPDPYFDDLFCGAAKKAYLSCERVVPTERFLDDGCVHTLTINRSLVSGVVEAPFGAHPTSCVPRYGIDREHLEEYSAAAAGNQEWEAYQAKYVTSASYIDAVGGAERLESIAAPVF